MKNYQTILNNIPSLVEEETKSEILDMVVNKAKDGMIFVETGCWMGSTVCRIANTIRESKKDIKVYAVDTWLCDNMSEASKIHANAYNDFYNKFWSNVCTMDLQNIINPIQRDSIEAASLFEDDSISFIFLDSNHDATYVQNEVRAWFPKMKKDSIIVGHDAPAVLRHVIPILGQATYITSTNGSYMYKIGKGLD